MKIENSKSFTLHLSQLILITCEETTIQIYWLQCRVLDMYVCILARLSVKKRSVYKNKVKIAGVCPITQFNSNKTAFLLAMQT
jgi:hypothetical protein